MSDSSTPGEGLPETFDEFLLLSEVRTCESCGDDVPLRYMEGNQCVGCQYRPSEDGDRDE